MSRQDPKWARTATYPAGPNAWNGQATTSTPASDYATPDTLLPAEEYNAVLRAVALEGIQAAQRAAVASPWASVDVTPEGALLDLAWSGGNEAWMGLIDSGANTDLFLFLNASEGTTLPFQFWRLNIAPPNTATHLWCFPSAVIVLSDAGTFTLIDPSGLSYPTGVAGTAWDDIMGLGNGTATAFAVSHSGTNTLIFKSTNSGTSWSTVTVPAHFSTYLGGWASSDTSGTATVFCPKTAGAQSKVLRCDTSGATATPSSPVTGNVCGVCYDDETSSWFLFAISGTDTLVYQSTDDAVTFASVATIADFYVDSVASAAGVIVVKGSYDAPLESDTSGTQYGVRYCMTDDIEKWYAAQSGHLGSGTDMLVEGGGQNLAMKTTTQVLFSGNVGLLQTDG